MKIVGSEFRVIRVGHMSQKSLFTVLLFLSLSASVEGGVLLDTERPEVRADADLTGMFMPTESESNSGHLTQSNSAGMRASIVSEGSVTVHVATTESQVRFETLTVVEVIRVANTQHQRRARDALFKPV